MTRIGSRVCELVLILGAVGCAEGQSGTIKPAVPSGSPSAEHRELMDSVGAIGIDSLYAIGETDERADYTFGELTSVTGDTQGNLLVCDVQDRQVRRYDRSGRFLGAIGRRGNGPREYSHCEPLLALGDTLFVNDVGNGRIVWFALDSDRAGIIRWPSAYAAVAMDSMGRFWAWESRRRGGGDPRSRDLAVAYDRDRTPVDSIPLALRMFPAGMQSLTAVTEDGALSSRVDSISAILPDGRVAVALESDYRIEMRSSSGPPTVITRPATAIPYRADERREWERMLAFAPQPQAPLPNVKPIIRALRGDDLGRLWVKLADSSYRRESRVPNGSRRPGLTHGEQGVWDLFDITGGDYIGRLRLPVGSELIGSRRDVIWVRRNTDEGYLVVMAYRLKPGREAQP